MLTELFVTVIGQDRHKNGTKLVFDVLQHPKLNKQVCSIGSKFSSWLHSVEMIGTPVQYHHCSRAAITGISTRMHADEVRCPLAKKITAHAYAKKPH